jgi:hypothetical protein
MTGPRGATGVRGSTGPSGSGLSPATTVTGPDAPGASPVVGTGTHYARDDHDHGSLAAPVPTDSHTATVAFGALALGTPKRNTLGYDVVVNVSISISAAVGGSIESGVGPSATPTTDEMTPALSAATLVSFSQYVPAGYYLSVVTTGTITAGTPVVQVTPA